MLVLGRKRLVLLLAGLVALAAAVAAALAVASHDSASTSSSPPAVATRAFAGVPQSGTSLGDPNAPALYEFADLQCPYCAEFSRNVLPSVVDRYVRSGQVRLVFDGLAFIGPDSEKALRAVAAAGVQNRLWDVVDRLYAAQGAENSGWVTDELLRKIGESVAGLDVDRWLADTASVAGAKQIAASAAHATALGVTSTPTFVLGTSVLQLEALTPDAFAAALDPLLAE